MRRAVTALAVMAAACLVAPSAAAAPPPAATPDQFTTVIASTLDAGMAPVLGTDGRRHVVYELLLTNAKPVPATLSEIQVLDAARPATVVATFAGDDLKHRVRLLSGHTIAPDLTLAEDVSRLVLIDLTFPATGAVPGTLLHRFRLTGQPVTGGTTPAPLDYTAAPFTLAGRPPVIGPPLAGKNWVAINGCCSSDSVHRNTVLPVNGHLSDTQRFAIDYMRLDDQGRLVHGDPGDVRNYAAYGAQILAVADGTVKSALGSLPDQAPGSLPDPSAITLDTVDGNHVVLDIGGGNFAFYAHMQPGSVRVKVGDRVRRGQVLGLLGNTGNSSAPHLHFHIMNGPSVLGSDGLPYVEDGFALAGTVSRAQFDAATSLEGVWNQGLFPRPDPRRGQYPLDLDIVDFPG
jgi:Peptidase family M23